MEQKKITLSESEMPRKWYNVIPDIPNGIDAPLDPETKKPCGPEKLSRIFAMGVIEQEMSPNRFIDIPEEVLDVLTLWRPTPLYRAYNLERMLGVKAHIYYKYEGVSPSGSHKTNTAVAQAYYNKREGIKRIATETGAGQWGCALSFACQKFGIECMVYMVRCSFEQKPYRKSMMQLYGAKVTPSPSPSTAVGRDILAKMPDTPGSLGIAISEAIEDTLSRNDTRYALGSVLNHVCLHQTVIGEEAKLQFAKAGEYPDVVIGCCGGGSNFAGIVSPFVPDKLSGKKIRLLGVEPEACPTLTRGHYAYDFGDVAKTTPIMRMYTLGHDFIPASIHAGGLRYHGMAPLVSALMREKLIEAVSVRQTDCFAAAMLFAKSEGIVPAPESSHAIRAAIDEALAEKNSSKVILFNLSGHGHFDMTSYDRYLAGGLKDYEYPEEAINAAWANLPKV